MRLRHLVQLLTLPAVILNCYFTLDNSIQIKDLDERIYPTRVLVGENFNLIKHIKIALDKKIKDDEWILKEKSPVD
jgi:hypothetical protein